jgi:hypothetical protein
MERAWLVHTVASLLWDTPALHHTANPVSLGRLTMAAHQWFWGHRAKKMTLWYICGVEPGKPPPMPMKLREPTRVVEFWKRKDDRRQISQPEGERRALELALRVLESARRVRA